MRRTGILVLAFMLTTLAVGQTYDALIVKSVVYGDRHVSVDAGPAICDGNGCTAGYHGATFGCNTEAPTCYTPEVGERGRIVPTRTKVYDGPNLTIEWVYGPTATYALYSQY
jgi:hypothetical protein